MQLPKINIPKKYLKIGAWVLGILTIVLIIVGSIAYSKREALLQKMIVKAIAKANNDYDLDVKIGEAGFSGLSTVHMTNISVVPKERDTLTTISDMTIGVKLWPLIFGDVKLAEMNLKDGRINVVFKDSLSNLDFFLKRKKKDNSENKPKVALSEIANNLLNQILYKVPDDMDSFIQSANKVGYDILLMNSPIDNHFVQHLEQKLEKTSLKRVDSSVASKLIDKDENVESVLTEDQSIAVKEVFEKAITKPGYTVEIVGLNPEELPVTVTMDEFMRRMKDMAAMGGGMGFYGNMPDSYKVAINGNHKLISKILETENEETKGLLAKQAVDLALLAQGMLTGAELTAFVSRSVDLI